MSSEDYQNELNNESKEQDTSVKLEDFNVPDEADGISFDEKITSEIPVDVDTMGVVIDKAPSLSTDALQQESDTISENDINDLMADLMSSMDSNNSNNSNKSDNTMLTDMVMDEETIEAGRALEEYLNSPVEQLINHPEMTASLGLEIPSLESLESMQSISDSSLDELDFPSMPHMPDIPEVVERPHEESVINEDVNVEQNDAFSGFNLEPITIDNFDERFVERSLNDMAMEGDIISEDEVASENDMMPAEGMMIEEPAMLDESMQEMDMQQFDMPISNMSLADMSEDAPETSDDGPIQKLQFNDFSDDGDSVGEIETESSTDFSELDALLSGILPAEENVEEPVVAPITIEEPIVAEETVDIDVPAADDIIAADISLNELVTEESTTEEPTIEEPTIEESAVEDIPVDGSNVEEVPAEEPIAIDIDVPNEAAVAIEESASAEDIVPIEEAISTEDSVPSTLSAEELEDMKKELAESMDDEDDAPDENDIEKLLANAQKEAEKSDDADDRESMSLEEILQTSNDGKADDIGELLDKAERNEAVDEGISALLSGEDMPPVDIDSITDGTEAELDPKAAKKAEKLRLKEEKKEAKRKAKEAKAAEKLAKKNAKKGIEPIQKLSFDAPGTEDDNTDAPAIPSVEDISASGIEHNTDMSDIEALLAGADSAGADSSNNVSGDNGPINDIFGQTEDIFGQNTDSESAAPEFESAEGDSIDSIPEKNSKDAKTNPIKAFFGKIVNFLTEEDEEDAEKSEIILSDENAAILDELNGEEVPDKKKKKKKKNKKGKKESSGSDENAEDLPEKKPPKKKKEKKPKKVDENAKPEPKISKKKIAMVSLVCIMLGVVIFLVTYFTADYTVKRSGRDAFLNEDYQTCYQNFYGKKLTESEQVMYNRSECILKIQIWLREYELYVSEGSEVKALDSLIQSVDSYPALKATSEEWGCLDKVEPVYDNMVQILQEKYGLPEAQALEIAAIEDDVIYTRVVNAIVNGVSYEDALNYIYTDDISGNTPIEEVEIPANMDDMLPEEDGISGESFIEP